MPGPPAGGPGGGAWGGVGGEGIPYGYISILALGYWIFTYTDTHSLSTNNKEHTNRRDRLFVNAFGIAVPNPMQITTYG